MRGEQWYIQQSLHCALMLQATFVSEYGAAVRTGRCAVQILPTGTQAHAVVLGCDCHSLWRESAGTAHHRLHNVHSDWNRDVGADSQCLSLPLPVSGRLVTSPPPPSAARLRASTIFFRTRSLPLACSFIFALVSRSVPLSPSLTHSITPFLFIPSPLCLSLPLSRSASPLLSLPLSRSLCLCLCLQDGQGAGYSHLRRVPTPDRQTYRQIDRQGWGRVGAGRAGAGWGGTRQGGAGRPVHFSKT